MPTTIRTIRKHLESMKRADNAWADRYVRDVGWLLNRRDNMITETEFAVANGHGWTPEDWQNWLDNHLKPILGITKNGNEKSK